MEQRRHFAVDKLSVEGRQLVDRMLGDGATYAEIIAKLDDTTGEKIAPSALQRYNAFARDHRPQEPSDLGKVAKEILDVLKEIRDRLPSR